jgi:hypothetical protein
VRVCLRVCVCVFLCVSACEIECVCRLDELKLHEENRRRVSVREQRGEKGYSV